MDSRPSEREIERDIARRFWENPAESEAKLPSILKLGDNFGSPKAMLLYIELGI